MDLHGYSFGFRKTAETSLMSQVSSLLDLRKKIESMLNVQKNPELGPAARNALFYKIERDGEEEEEKKLPDLSAAANPLFGGMGAVMAFIAMRNKRLSPAVQAAILGGSYGAGSLLGSYLMSPKVKADKKLSEKEF